MNNNIKKTFLLCDDENLNLFDTRITRTDKQIIEGLRTLEVGDVYLIEDDKANIDGLRKGISSRYWIRES
jgi:hypothetical protein